MKNDASEPEEENIMRLPLDRKRLPPGQALTQKWPLLTFGETPRVDLSTWTFRCYGLVEQEISWTWKEFLALPQVTITSDRKGRGSRALVVALVASEQRRDELKADLDILKRGHEAVSRLPPLVWIRERLAVLQEVLEQRTERSGLLLRALLGRIRLEPVSPEIGRPRYRAISKLQVLALLESRRRRRTRNPVLLLCSGGGGGS